MEKKKFELCTEVLQRLEAEGILEKILLVGSWCMPVYEVYFKGKGAFPVLRTRDLEFLIPVPPRFDKKTDLQELFKDLGFLVEFKGDAGHIIFQHPDLILEFLAPARGRESRKPVPVPKLGINAQSLRFMDALARNPICLKFRGVSVRVPHPADFALHKLLIASRRKDSDKAKKDRGQAVALLEALREMDETSLVTAAFCEMPKTWQSTIRKELTGLDEMEWVGRLG